jgi:hypothetical protein
MNNVRFYAIDNRRKSPLAVNRQSIAHACMRNVAALKKARRICGSV